MNGDKYADSDFILQNNEKITNIEIISPIHPEFVNKSSHYSNS
jgi:hypothetical protein